MKKILVVLLAFTLALPVMAQEDAKSSSVLTSIAQTQRQNAAKAQKYHFKQTKHSPMLVGDAVRTGYMVVGPQKHMEWHYTDTADFALIMEGEKCFMLKDGKKSPVKGRSGRMASRLAAMMMELADGGGLMDGKQFESSLAETSAAWVVTLDPRKRDLKRVMQKVVLTFDKQTLRIQSVKIVEDKDSFTQIDFEKK